MAQRSVSGDVWTCLSRTQSFRRGGRLPNVVKTVGGCPPNGSLRRSADPHHTAGQAAAGGAGTRPGVDWLLSLNEHGKLPKEGEGDAGRLLRKSPYQGRRNKAMLLFPAPGKLDPKKLPAPAELAKRTGDATRGKQVWDASFAGAAPGSKARGAALALLRRVGSRGRAR